MLRTIIPSRAPEVPVKNRKCETFGCPNIGLQMYQVAPATNVWLCGRCIQELEKEKVH